METEISSPYAHGPTNCPKIRLNNNNKKDTVQNCIHYKQTNKQTNPPKNTLCQSQQNLLTDFNSIQYFNYPSINTTNMKCDNV